jgi:Protein of unknown function (DUF3048) N-terminal domain/Protein of unknown function (DUF3048) C-terminal domain
MIRRVLFTATAVALVATACSSSEPTTTTIATTTTTTMATTTTSVPTTTTTEALEVADTINGLPGAPGTEDRRVVAVKIDNHPAARPQSGLQEADAVYEVMVEAGLTRFIALFHQSDSTYVGPVRSARPTDSTLIRPLGGPLQVSGGQSWVLALYRDQGTPLIGDLGITTYRMSHRPAPHNLYSNTEAIRQFADDRGMDDDPPPPLFTFGEPTPTEEPAMEITFDWSEQPNVVWEYDGERYLRFNEDEPHNWVDSDFDEGQVTADTIVVLKGEEYTAKPANGSGSAVPATVTTGEGEALVFTDGGVITGRWTRPEITDLFELTTTDGDPIVIKPGKLWIAVFPDGRDVTW